MKIYMIRHGETLWNKEGKIQGSCDIELNERGLMQANEVKEKLKNISFDVCFASPLKRAKKTAEIVINDKCDIVIDELLKERGYGAYEGKKAQEMDIEVLKLWDYKENYSDNDVESLDELLKRATMFIEKIKNNCSNDSTVLIVSHGGFIKGLYYAVNGYNKDTDFMSFHLENCGVYECDISPVNNIGVNKCRN